MLYKHTCDDELSGQGDAHSGPVVSPRLRRESPGLPDACGAEQSGTLMVSKSVVCYGREGDRMVRTLWTEAELKG